MSRTTATARRCVREIARVVLPGAVVIGGLFTAEARAQVRVLQPRPPVLGALENDAGDPEQSEQHGPKVQMPVSLNIDRHLRKAEDFLEREKYSSAFAVIQAVIEGRTVLEDGADPDADNPEADASTGNGVEGALLSAKHAVFTSDGRIYRPVKRLCHELLASLEPPGVAAYRAEFEFAAEAAFDSAWARADVLALERVSDRYFLTLHGARALLAAGDLRRDAAQFRAALQDYRTLLETYPEAGRAEAGVDDTYLRVRIALCYAWLGDVGRAREEIAQLEELVGKDTALRIGGELVATGGLTDLPVFARRTADRRGESDGRPDGDRNDTLLTSELVPLWEARFDEPRPYRPMRESSRRSQRIVITQDGLPQASIQPSLFEPGTSATVMDGRVTFLDHFRIRMHDALGGSILAQTGEATSERLHANRPRARVSTIDTLTARIVTHRGRIHTVLGPEAGAKDLRVLLDNRIETYDARTLEPIWSSEAHRSLASLTFLAAPTPFGDRLLVPVLDGATIALQAVDAATGTPAWRVKIHSGGCDLARPLTPPVVVDQGLAFLMSGAGAIAAVDAHIGELRWIRRYERVHPLRPNRLRAPRERNANAFFGQSIYHEVSRLPGFAPSDLVAANGLVAFAPSDGNVLSCLDGATGEPVWMLNQHQRVPAGNRSRALYLVGHEDGRLVVGGEYDVWCVDLATGVRLWRAELDNIGGTSRWRGRGTVHDGRVLIPGLREIVVRPIDDSGETPWRTLVLPEISIGHDPLEGPFNLTVDGIYLTTAYAGGLATYSTVDSLLHAAEQAELPEEASLLQAQAGDLLSAFATLEAVDPESVDPPRRDRLAQRVLSISGELALAMAAHGAVDDALGILDRARARLDAKKDRKRWHLLRIEVFDVVGDSARLQEEQRALYALMDGGN